VKRQKKKYEKPRRPWDRTRIEAEKKLKQNYGLRRKKEIWRAESILRNYRRQARNLAAKKDKEKEKILIEKLVKIGLLNPNADLDDVLVLTVENLLERRLQTLTFKKGIARTARQARQLIVHGHVAIDGRRVRWPGTIVPVSEEGKIKFYGKEVGVKNETKP
jgi:small subunit ribosomal protein S4